MRKQELIHLHSLLVQIRTVLTSNYDPPDGAFAEYERHGVHPRAIYARKDAHHQAITHLTDGIELVLTDRDTSGVEFENVTLTSEVPIES